MIEVHTQLVSKLEHDSWNRQAQNNYLILSPKDELVYLAYHYAHQHTLLHAKWLHDIYLLSRLHPDIWQKETWDMAKKKELYSSLMITAQALNCKYQIGIEIPSTPKKMMFSKLISLDFINHSEKYPAKYYVAKHLIKDSFLAAISYDFKWLYFHLKKLFRR